MVSAERPAGMFSGTQRLRLQTSITAPAFVANLRQSIPTWSEIRHVLDVGCGEGSLTVKGLAVAFPNAEVLGVDKTKKSIDDANLFVEQDKAQTVRFAQVTIDSHSPFPLSTAQDGKWDAIVMNNAATHINSGMVFLRCRDMLHRGGYFIATDLAGGQYIKNAYPNPRFTQLQEYVDTAITWQGGSYDVTADTVLPWMYCQEGKVTVFTQFHPLGGESSNGRALWDCVMMGLLDAAAGLAKVAEARGDAHLASEEAMRAFIKGVHEDGRRVSPMHGGVIWLTAIQQVPD